MRSLVRVYLVIAYYFSWVVFGAGGLLLNLVCGFFLLFPRGRPERERVRKIIRWLFEAWTKWFHASRVVRITWNGFDTSPLRGGTVYVANHPSLVDAPVLLSRLPNAICIFKPALLRNPLIAPAAILAGYASGDQGVDLIRDAGKKVADGCSLLIFPEGTRTRPGLLVNPMKAGFALIAQRAHAPIRLISIRSTPGLVSKGVPWWKAPPLPGHFEITLGEEFISDDAESPTAMTELVHDRLASMLSPAASSPSSACLPPTSC